MKKNNLNRTKAVIHIALMTSVTMALSFIRIPFYPVPFTLQTLATMFAAILLPRWSAVISQLLFIGIGLLGVPIFSQGGGLGYIFNPTFGYILFLPIMCFLISILYKKLKVIGLIIPAILLLIFGTFYYILLYKIPFDRNILSVFVGFTLIFIPAEALKAICAHLLGQRLKKMLYINN